MKRLSKKIIVSATLLAGFACASPVLASPQLQKIVASDGVARDLFGYSVLRAEGDLFIGAQHRSDKDGAVYVYSAGSDYQSPDAILVPPPGVGASNYFGTAIARKGNELFIGAQRSNAGTTGAGAVFVFQKSSTSGMWNHSQTLVATGTEENGEAGASGDWFGNAIAIHGKVLLIGAPRHEVDGVSKAGAVYEFVQQENGAWVQSSMLALLAPVSNDQFGASVAIQDGKALVGMPGYDATVDVNGEAQEVRDAGRVFAYNVGPVGGLTQTQIIDADPVLARAAFGTSVKIAQNKAVVGSPYEPSGGAVYAYTNQEGNWNATQRLLPDNGFFGLQFGFAVSLSPNGQQLAVGAPGAVDPGFDSGEVHRFRAEGSSSWVSLGAPLVSDDLASRDFLGTSVSAADDSTVAAGARLDDDKGSSSGSVYIFDATKPLYAPVAPLGALLLGFGGLVALRRKYR